MPTYTFTTIAGLAGTSGSADGTNQAARFYNPSEIAVDRNGVIYVSDLLNNTIRQVAPVGTNWVVTTLAGLAGMPGAADGTNSDARFYKPNGIAVDLAGNLFVADHYNHTIRELTHLGTNWVVTTIAGLAGIRGHDDGTNSQALFYSPTGIAVDDADHLYVVDTANHTIRGIVPVGTNWVVSTLAGTPLKYGFGDGINGLAEFDYPYSIAINSAGTLYVTDWGNNAIRQLTASGPDWSTVTIANFSGSPGTNDGSAGSALFNGPNGITLDSSNNLYVTDQLNYTIRLLEQGSGGWSVGTLAGAPKLRGSADGTSNNARFNWPWGIALDSLGNLYVADELNNTIRKGTFSVTIPSLQIALAGNQVVISWPAAATNYLLETTVALSTPSLWTPVTNGLVVAGDSVFFTNSAGTARGFFRLRKD